MKKAPEHQTTDRFDLEQQILDCWKIIDDLQLAAPHGEEAVDAVATLYDIRFNQLWDTFERMVHERKM